MGVEIDCMIQFRGITLDLSVDGEDQVQWVLAWLANGFRVEGAECRVRLMFYESEMDPVRLAAVRPSIVVKHLSISACMRNHLREYLFTAMTQPPDPPASSWLLARMESLSVEFKAIESQKELISMLRSRYEGTTQSAETDLRCPMNLRSVELRGQPRTEGLVEEIRGILGEVDVFWAN
ncbi:hypothetical protein M407DRAFT_241168 [Tulasnella calospora MUT 4182]|uniref:Uncharacterized protein n=1 Tax=Tulasnella calospora MUT 4182 TaxID=1051891 RepID=A0A0C3QKR5_9AGAM|nr:hypothetical protein M407DRAFT_241168 [Tulasnella calospora MUT 4182]